MGKKRASIIAGSVLAVGLAIGGVATGVLVANKPVNVTYYANNGTPAVTAQINKGDILNLSTRRKIHMLVAGEKAICVNI